MKLFSFLFPKKENIVDVLEMPSLDDLIIIYPVHIRLHEAKVGYQYWIEMPDNKSYNTFYNLEYVHEEIVKKIVGIVSLHSDIDQNEIDSSKVLKSIQISYCGEVKIHDKIKLDVKFVNSTWRCI